MFYATYKNDPNSETEKIKECLVLDYPPRVAEYGQSWFHCLLRDGRIIQLEPEKFLIRNTGTIFKEINMNKPLPTITGTAIV